MPQEKNPKEEKDWSTAAAGKVVGAVAEFGSRITSPFKSLAKFLAYLPLILLILAGIIILLSIGVFRIVDVYLPQDTWVAHFILGGAYSLLGLFVWFKRPRFPN